MLMKKAVWKILKRFSNIQFNADMITDYEAAKLMFHKAANAIDKQEKNSTVMSAWQKSMLPMCFQICNEALQYMEVMVIWLILELKNGSRL